MPVLCGICKTKYAVFSMAIYALEICATCSLLRRIYAAKRNYAGDIYIKYSIFLNILFYSIHHYMRELCGFAGLCG